MVATGLQRTFIILKISRICQHIKKANLLASYWHNNDLLGVPSMLHFLERNTKKKEEEEV